MTEKVPGALLRSARSFVLETTVPVEEEQFGYNCINL